MIGRRDTDCQAKDIYQGKRFVFKQISPCDLDVVFDHGQYRVNKRRDTMLKIIPTRGGR